MPFQYSSFISYRHNENDKKYFDNLKGLLQSEIFNVTNIHRVFYDKESIKWGDKWDDEIYSGIGMSIFFLPIWYQHYLSEDDLWCARELFYALEVEKVIKAQLDDQDKDNFYFIFPLIYRGSSDLLPHTLSRKTTKDLTKYIYHIINKKESARIQDFKLEIYNNLNKHFRIMEKYKHINFQDLFKQIKMPSDDELKEWIKEQKLIITEKEAEHLPILIKNRE